MKIDELTPTTDVQCYDANVETLNKRVQRRFSSRSHARILGEKNNFSGVFFEDKVVYAGFKRTMTRIDDGGSVVRRSNVLECLEDVKLTYRGVLRALYSSKYRTVGP